MLPRGPTSMRNQRQVAEAAIVPGERPPPPAGLNEAEQVTWVEIVNRLPQDWFTAENRPLLKELCRHIGHADCLSEDIAKVRLVLAELPNLGLAPSQLAKEVKRQTANYHALLRLHAFQTERIGNLATKLRLSQQTRIPAGKATPKIDAAPAGAKPWQGWENLPQVEGRPS